MAPDRTARARPRTSPGQSPPTRHIRALSPSPASTTSRSRPSSPACSPSSSSSSTASTSSFSILSDASSASSASSSSPPLALATAPSPSDSSVDSPLCSPSLRPSAADAHRVLLVVSAQRGPLSAPPHGIPHAARVRTHIARVLAEARAAHPPPAIVHVRHAGRAGDTDAEGSDGWELANAPLPGEIVVDKRKASAFVGTKLDELVNPLAEVIVVGCGTDYCIRNTCQSLVKRDNPVMLIRGAHGTYDQPAILNGPHGVALSASQVERQVENELDDLGVLLMEMSDVNGIFNGR